MTLDVYLEVGAKRTFAGAIDWPGWCRSGRSEPAALARLLAYAPRYATAIENVTASAVWPAYAPPTGLDDLRVVERLPGNATIDFGAPGRAPEVDSRPLDEIELERQVALLARCWATLDGAAASARGVELRKGPRGGGRDLGAILGHVADAEMAYLSRLGTRLGAAANGDGGNAVADRRETVLAALRAAARGEPLPFPTRS